MTRRWMTEAQVMDYLMLGRNSVRRLAAECGAAYHIGRCLRYDRQAIDEHLEAKRNAPAATETSLEV